jgi:hypothetical protein
VKVVPAMVIENRHLPDIKPTFHDRKPTSG